MLKKYINNQLTKVILTILIIWTLGAFIISIIEPGSFKKISNSLKLFLIFVPIFQELLINNPTIIVSLVFEIE